MIERKSWAPWFKDARARARNRVVYTEGWYMTNEGQIPLSQLSPEDWHKIVADDARWWREK